MIANIKTAKGSLQGAESALIERIGPRETPEKSPIWQAIERLQDAIIIELKKFLAQADNKARLNDQITTLDDLVWYLAEPCLQPRIVIASIILESLRRAFGDNFSPPAIAKSDLIFNHDQREALQEFTTLTALRQYLAAWSVCVYDECLSYSTISTTPKS